MSRKAWLWALQTVAAAVLIYFVARTLRTHWSEFHSFEIALQPRPLWLALSVGAVFATYALQVASWRRLLAGWGQGIPFGTAARIWCVANLGRYVPGKVWSVAGLVVLAQRAGVAGWAAAGSTVAVQAVGLGGAVALIVATTPAAASAVRLAAAALAAGATLALLAWPRAVEWVGRLVQPGDAWRALRLRSALESLVLSFLGWTVYGLAFWVLARGLGFAGALAPATAAGVFALGYILGLVALFAPGGVLVREAAFIALLTPIIGSGGAVALSIASRIQLTLTEAAAAVVALMVEKRLQGGRG